jgi:hypothetical protein
VVAVDSLRVAMDLGVRRACPRERADELLDRRLARGDQDVDGLAGTQLLGDHEQRLYV